MSKALFIFRRDLRIFDNTGLLAALEEYDEVIPVFIFNPRQLEEHPYRSLPGLSFLITSLRDLNNQLSKLGTQLSIFSGEIAETLQLMYDDQKFDAVYVNRDYTPFAQKRDEVIEQWCTSQSIVYKQFADILLHEPEQIKNGSGEPYKVFTPFMRQSRTFAIRRPNTALLKNFFQKVLAGSSLSYLDKYAPDLEDMNILVDGGRSEGLKLLAEFNAAPYKNDRDVPSIKGTSYLSAHNKFGTLSIREIYWHIADKHGEDSTFINELYWRDFYTHVAFHFPSVFGNNFNKQYDAVEWSSNAEWLNLWKQGKTGFPIVDAGMRQLNKTGYMHNRVRMIVSSFLTKDMHIHWKEGEKYFAQKLTDYDPCVNNGGWQWAASTGTDAQPYFRIFNPWLQQKKFDPDCVYIREWIPELRDVDVKKIHRLYEVDLDQSVGYPSPVLDHAEEKKETLARFSVVKK